MGLHDLRERIGYVPQKGVLFSGTIDSNIRYGKEDATKEEVNRAAEIAQAQEFIVQKEKGMESEIAQGGTNVSGGQKQRVAIARALASDPQILLCDEATSALDPQTTSSILELLQDINQKFGITIVIITHQMSVVREICTHVAIMKDGEVKEQGLVEEIFSHPKSQVAKELISKDSGNDVESKKLTQSEIQDGEIVRIVFSENSAFEPVIANLILTFHEPVNILKANTKNVGGVAKGEMILQFMSDSTNVPEMKKFLTERGLEIGEAN